MDLTLKRKRFCDTGIFGELHSDDVQDGLVAYSLEHAYPISTTWRPKLPNGKYACVRGLHRLHSMVEDFETFEVRGVPGHTNILFHPGNYQRDSEGCILLGCKLVGDALTHSKDAFHTFMELQENTDMFILVVEGSDV